MKLLILGGTRFVGRHLVRSARARGHDITLFNRGKLSSEVIPGVETIIGDRNADLTKLRGQSWDVVVDTCGYLPRSVRASAVLLSGVIDRYVFVSSISAYADLSVDGIKETAPLATLSPEQLEAANQIDLSGQPSAPIFGSLYPGLKAASEQALQEVCPNKVLIIRPGLIVGPDDYTDRFTYWVVRAARGGEVLAPGRSDRYVQFIDVRDLAEWTMRMIEDGETGAYNAVGLPEKTTMGSLLKECGQVSGSDASFTWVSESFLLQEQVAPWREMPLWLPEEGAAHMKGMMSVNVDKAVQAGLTFRALSDTIKDTLTWHESNRRNEALTDGLDADKERMLLRKWHQTH